MAPLRLFPGIPERNGMALLMWVVGRVNLTLTRVFPMIQMEHPNIRSMLHIPVTRICGMPAM